MTEKRFGRRKKGGEKHKKHGMRKSQGDEWDDRKLGGEIIREGERTREKSAPLPPVCPQPPVPQLLLKTSSGADHST